jgi:hypothetical protein
MRDRWLPALPFLVAAPLTAQPHKLPSPIDHGKIVQTHDVRGVPASPERLVAALRGLVQPALEEGEDIAALAGGLLVAHARPESQAWIEQTLRASIARAPSGIDVQARIVDVAAPLFARVVQPRLRGAASGATRGERGHVFATLPEAILAGDEHAELLRTLAEGGAQQIAAPRARIVPFQAARILVGKEISYVKDFNVEIMSSGEVVADPVVGKLIDGVQLDVEGLHAAGDAIGLALTFVHNTDVALAKFTTSLAGDDRKLTLELPSWKHLELEAAALLPPGSGAVYAFPERGGRHTVLFVRVDRRDG